MFEKCNYLEELFLFEEDKKESKENSIDIEILNFEDSNNSNHFYSNLGERWIKEYDSILSYYNSITLTNKFSESFSSAYLPNISKWNTCIYEDMSYMFSGCSSLKF